MNRTVKRRNWTIFVSKTQLQIRKTLKINILITNVIYGQLNRRPSPIKPGNWSYKIYEMRSEYFQEPWRLLEIFDNIERSSAGQRKSTFAQQ